MYHRSNVLANSLDILRCIAEYYSLVVQDLFFEQNTHLIKNLIGKKIKKGARALKRGIGSYSLKRYGISIKRLMYYKKVECFEVDFLCQTNLSVLHVSFKYPTTYQKHQRYIFSSILVK
jgi:CRISPR/Cas system endoribonuclease Cas6 (RAMP superfamily)